MQSAINSAAQSKAGYADRAVRELVVQFFSHRLQKIMKHQPQDAEAHHAAEADDAVDVQKQPAVVPQTQPEIPDANITDDVFHHAGHNHTKQEQQHRMPFQRLQRVDPQGADPVNRQPGPIQNAPVSQQPFRDPIEDLFIDPAHKAASEENQKKDNTAGRLSPFGGWILHSFPFCFMLLPNFKHISQSSLISYKKIRRADRCVFQGNVSVL